jgi:hypothetical protein
LQWSSSFLLVFFFHFFPVTCSLVFAWSKGPPLAE